MVYYVYVLLNPLKPGIYEYDEYKFEYEPFYVGKGKGKRKYETIRDQRNPLKKAIITNIRNNNESPLRIIIKNELDECSAFELEKLLIKLIGKKIAELGPLTNFTDGGDGSSGYKQSKETLEKRKEAMLKYRPYFKSEDFKNKMRKIMAERKNDSTFI